MDAKFYVYAHVRATGPRAGSVFYVGKGQGRRAWAKDGRNGWHKRTADKHGFEHLILAEGMTEAEAYALEYEVVLALREHLCNITDGGHGIGSGAMHPLFGKPRPESVKAALRAANIGKRASEETRTRMRASSKRLPPTNKGISHSPEARAKMSAAHTGKSKSEFHKANIAKANLGKVRGPEIALRGWATRRASAAAKAMLDSTCTG